MRLLDAAAILLLVVAVVAFAFGEMALSRADDFEAAYGILVGVVSMRSAVQLARPGNA